MNLDNFSEWLADASREIGAHSAACIRMDNPVLRLRIVKNNAQVANWLKLGMHGEMDYLERMLAEKANPWKTFPFAKSVIVLAFCNRWGDPSATHPFPVPANDALLGYISAYAKEADYHSTGRAMLSELTEMLGKNIHAEATVDTAAVYERLFAVVGGLGAVGDNDLLRVPDSGDTRVFIGCLFVDAELPEVIHEAQMPFACATCHACVKNCPTGAIQSGQPIDARKCISYLTIEKSGTLSHEEGESIGNWLFGCDDCTMVCPPRVETDTRIPVDLEWLLKAPASEIRRTIKGNATAYAGVTQLRKNAVVVLKNMNSLRAQDLLQWVSKNTGSELIRRQISLW
jgi:epoxyqueuosine reductase